MRMIAMSKAIGLTIAVAVLSGCADDGFTQDADEVRGDGAVAAQASLDERILLASPYVIAESSELLDFVVETAEGAIEAHCAACHGPDLTGRPGVPNLVDFEWLWGITFEETNDVAPVMEIQQTILYGIRNTDCPEIEHMSYYGGCIDTRYSEMPAYLADGMLGEQQVADLTEYVVALSGREADPEARARGEAFAPLCTECHGQDGTGYKPFGGPDLTDDIWLYGDDRETIFDVIANGRLGHCPAWGKTLDPVTIKSLAVYIWRRVMGY